MGPSHYSVIKSVIKSLYLLMQFCWFLDLRININCMHLNQKCSYVVKDLTGAMHGMTLYC